MWIIYFPIILKVRGILSNFQQKPTVIVDDQSNLLNSAPNVITGTKNKNKIIKTNITKPI